MYILITGVAGFIGSAVALKLLEQGKKVIGLDNLNDYYDVDLKKNRLKRCQQFENFQFLKLDIVNRDAIAKLFAENDFEAVVHLAAQAGVRYSVQNPHVYIDSNLVGFANILEGCRQNQVKHFVYASSSSVYGANVKFPFSEQDPVDHPLSLYGATKRANELMAHSYAHLYNLTCTGLRFFTVYGPWCRPDMALFKFANQIMAGEPISVFNYGKMKRDFTYIDDIVEGIDRVIHHLPSTLADRLSPNTSDAPFQIFNIGNNQPVELIHYINVLEMYLGKKAQIEFLPMQAGDVPNTYADNRNLEMAVGELPHTSVEVGISRFVDWYRAYYRLDILESVETI